MWQSVGALAKTWSGVMLEKVDEGGGGPFLRIWAALAHATQLSLQGARASTTRLVTTRKSENDLPKVTVASSDRNLGGKSGIENGAQKKARGQGASKHFSEIGRCD
jgi:hypothetical protein